MGRLSTLVLDNALGKPAAGVTIRLFRVSGDGHHKIAEVVTNADGRTDVVTDQAGVDDLLASLGF